MSEPLLSVLVAGLTKRTKRFGAELCAQLEMQSEELPVEVLVLLDNQKLSTGLKRARLLEQATGRFFTFVDDDDTVSPSYCTALCEAIKNNPDADVINFHIDYSVDGKHQYFAKFSKEYPDPPLVLRSRDAAYDKPSHTMCWRRELVKDLKYADAYWGEDVAWVMEARKRIQTQVCLDRVLYYYRKISTNMEHFDMQMKQFGKLLPNPWEEKASSEQGS